MSEPTEAGHILWSLPKTQEEAFKKWEIATKTIKVLIALDVISSRSVEQIIKFVDKED